MPIDTHLHSRPAPGIVPQPPRPAPPPRRDPCAESDQPCCPACGNVECLCRPRFFPGQLLTDEDLNRLQRYVINKNKLHNRHLNGWGVACGLEVVCDPCVPGNVVVRTGYALSPCGDDIVVCRDQAVNVCELIEQCRPSREPVCEPPYDRPPRECKGGTEKWVLAICYDERASRPITALTGAGDTACGCGTGNCTCGGKGCGKQEAPAPKTRKGYKPQCEPTQVCEGYRFVAYKAPGAAKLVGEPPVSSVKYGAGTSPDLLFAWLYANRTRFGPLLERVLCCVTRAMELRLAVREGKPADDAAALDTYRDYAEALQEFAADFALHRCSFVGKVETEAGRMRDYLKAASLVGGVTGAETQQRIAQLDLTWLEILTECFCSALLPACPSPAKSNCVPLAVVTVDPSNCRVIEICNWEERKLLISWTTIGYWLSWLPWGNLRRIVARLCCGDGRQRESYFALALIFGAVMANLRGEPAGAAQAKRAAGAAADDTVESAMKADSLLTHALGDFDRTRAGEPTGAPVWAALAARFVDGSALAPLAGAPVATEAEARELSVKMGVDELRDKVIELTTTLEEYKGTLETLKNLWRRI